MFEVGILFLSKLIYFDLMATITCSESKLSFVNDTNVQMYTSCVPNPDDEEDEVDREDEEELAREEAPEEKEEKDVKENEWE